MTDEDKKQYIDAEHGCFALLILYAIVAICICLLAMCSCTTKRQLTERIVVKTDTTSLNHVERDSIYLRDSIYISERTQGDTVYLTREHWTTAYKERVKTDTIYRAIRDTIYQTKEITKEKARTPWENTFITIGGVGFFLIIIILCLLTGRRFFTHRMI